MIYQKPFKISILILLASLSFSCSPKLTPPSLTADFNGWNPPDVEYPNQHKHWAYCLDVYDGDSVTLWIENGFNNFQLWKTRLLDIDAPEVRGSERELGLISKKWLADEILGKYIVIEAPDGKLDKYGRLLIRIYKDNLDFSQSINLKMVDLGLADIYLMKAADLMPDYEIQAQEDKP